MFYLIVKQIVIHILINHPADYLEYCYLLGMEWFPYHLTLHDYNPYTGEKQIPALQALEL